MTFLERAELLVSRDVPVIPILPRTKQAFIRNWHELATTDRMKIREWNSRDPRYNTGAVGKQDGFLVFDVDDIEVYHQLRTAGLDLKAVHTFHVQGKKESPCGHYYFRQTEASRALGNCDLSIWSRATGKKQSTMFDLKAHNAYVVGPGSIHPSGGTYTIIEDAEIIPMPEDLAAWIASHKAVVWVGEGEHGNDGTEGFSWRGGFSHEDRVLDIISHCTGKSYADIKAFILKYGYTHRHQADLAIAEFLFKKYQGDEDKAAEEFARIALHQSRRPVYYQMTLRKAAKWYAQRTGEMPTRTRVDWQDLLIRNVPLRADMRGSPEAVVANALVALRCAPAWQDVLGYDQFARKIAVQTLRPWEPELSSPEWTDADDTQTAKLPQDHGKGEGQEKHEYRRDNALPKWRGFHAFRRGLATNLHALGVSTELIRLIMRHSDVQTTQQHYIKPSKDEVKKAMAQFEVNWAAESKKYAELAKQPAAVN